MSLIDRIDPDEIVTLDDGFKYYWPNDNSGAFSAHNLREIADYLDSLNHEWEQRIEEYMEMDRMTRLDDLSVD